jgi:hypothetical protein
MAPLDLALLPAIRHGGTVLVLLLGCACLQAQELTVSAGVMQTDDARHSGREYEVAYRQDYTQNFAASVSYINEGHWAGHHRDGSALEIWGRLPFAQGGFSVALGGGVYYYYDTQRLPDGDSTDVHGTAAIVSASATAFIAERLFCRAMIHHISPNHGSKVTTASVGLGLWFGSNRKPTPGELGDTPSGRDDALVQELTVYAGQSVVNTFLSEKGRAYAVDYRRGLRRHVDWTVTLIHEGDPEIIRRSGLATQAWAVNEFFQDRLAIGIGFGPYFYIDRRHPATDGGGNPARIAGLGSLSMSQRLSSSFIVRLTVDRVGSNNGRDADIFLLGLGWQWPH